MRRGRKRRRRRRVRGGYRETKRVDPVLPIWAGPSKPLQGGRGEISCPVWPR